MWVYHSPIGNIFIKQLSDGTYGMEYNGTIWESAKTPQIEADNVFCHVTGCSEWDSLDGTILDTPTDLSEWEYIED